LIGGRSRRSGRSSGGRARSAKMRGRGTRGTRGGTRATERAAGSGDARRRSSMRDGGDRGRAGPRPPVPARAPSVTPGTRLLKKVPLRANVSGAFGKMAFEASDVRRDGETFTTRPSTGRFGWMFARHTSDASTDARFAIDARRSPSATRGLRRSRGETFATNLRCLFPDGGIRVETARGLRPRLRTPGASPFASPRPRWTTPRLSPRHARPRFPTLPSGRRDAVRCAGATRANTGNRLVRFSSGSFTENPLSPRPRDAVNGVF